MAYPQPRYLPCRIAVRFYCNRNRYGGQHRHRNHIFSRTAGKNLFPIVHMESMPSRFDREWTEHWLVEVLEETQPGRKGYLRAQPIRRLDTSEIRILLPGMYREDEEELRRSGVLILRPLEPGIWMPPLELYRTLRSRDPAPFALLVPLDVV